MLDTCLLFCHRKVQPSFTAGMPAPFLEVHEYLTEAHDYSQRLSEKIAVSTFNFHVAALLLSVLVCLCAWLHACWSVSVCLCPSVPLSVGLSVYSLLSCLSLCWSACLLYVCLCNFRCVLCMLASVCMYMRFIWKMIRIKEVYCRKTLCSINWREIIILCPKVFYCCSCLVFFCFFSHDFYYIEWFLCWQSLDQLFRRWKIIGHKSTDSLPTWWQICNTNSEVDL